MSSILSFEDYGLVSDEDWKRILDEDSITAARKKDEEKFTQLTTESYNVLKARCKNDLFFLNTAILGHNRLSPYLHGHLSAWMERNSEWQFKEILLPRGHFKSTVCTIGDSIQIVLPDVTHSQPWPRSIGPDCRLLICHETDGQASNFLFAITGHFLSNSLLMGLFPECVPSPRKHRINRHELELPRSHIWPEPTIDTMGVGGRSQGRHYNYIKFDDLIGDKARDSEVVMSAAKEWFDNIQAFFSKFTEDHFDLIGTRWAFDDLYSHVHDRYGDQILRYIRGVEEPTGPNGEIEPIFPEEFNSKALNILRKNRKVWTAQYANNPEEGATEWDKSWKRFYHWTGYNTIAVFNGKIETRINIRDLDICILYDPAMSGNAGIVVTGTDKSVTGNRVGRIFILEALKDEWKPPQACALMFRLVQRWQPRVVAIEEVLFSGLYKHWFEAEMKLRNVHFNIYPVPPVVGGKVLSKPMRVRGLSQYFSAGAIHFASQGQDDEKGIITEFDKFGATKDYHILDALAYGPEVWMPAFSRETWNAHKRAEEQLLGNRDNETGYSEIQCVGMP